MMKEHEFSRANEMNFKGAKQITVVVEHQERVGEKAKSESQGLNPLLSSFTLHYIQNSRF